MLQLEQAMSDPMAVRTKAFQVSKHGHVPLIHVLYLGYLVVYFDTGLAMHSAIHHRRIEVASFAFQFAI
ncbi:hypothetical protein CR103_21295 [Massilia psychrophila]|uniref:Uncharacterized protein n=1 Tax=Massilia psychrophila TaxID=1603353 RepID=A0A2G8SWH0_9BURK|nr:hypothetical protein CR103_21295 [Massilia psychrophila]